jgi:hypothetical protein
MRSQTTGFFSYRDGFWGVFPFSVILISYVYIGRLV